VTKRVGRLDPVFVELIPKKLSAGKLYVSMIYSTTQHLCACGCGKKVVLPLSPAEWSLRYDGETVSMNPSVGNWEYECKSHYWIDHSQIRWATAWTREKIEAGRKSDLDDLDNYLEKRQSVHSATVSPRVRMSWWRRFLTRLSRSRYE